MLAAQRPLLQLEQQLAALQGQRLGASIDLDRALGGGLEPPAPAIDNQDNNDLSKVPTP